MIKENVKIMNWRNGFLLSLVSYILYLIIWLILDDETANQLPGMATVDYVVDFLLCMLFTYISLGFSYLVFKILPFRTSYVWVIVYASCLLTLNNLVTFGMTSLFNLLWDETGNGLLDELINLKSATKLFSVLLASKRPLITELADKWRLKYPLLPTISPCPTMRLEAIRSIIPISCRRYPKSV